VFETRGKRLRLGNYEPLLQLATGGMATVYVARQIGAAGFERLVVIKRVHQHLLANHQFHDMFRDEARVASLVRHPNVVPVVDVVEAERELFLVMEYVESTALSTLVKAAAFAGKRLPIAVVVRIVADTLAGLHAAHEAVDMRGNRLEVVHRDVSPQNIIVGVDGGSRLIDFGVAKARHRLTETKSGSMKGKYGYMSPEQTRAMAIDRRADLFALGVVLHEALVGKRLFVGENEFDTIRRIAEMPIPAPSAIAPEIPHAVDEVVAKALQRERDSRFQNAAEFLEALEAAFLPAPIRDVATALADYCGERLSKRRTTLRAMLDGVLEPLAPEGGDAFRDLASNETATSASSPSARKRLLASGEGTESQIAATHDAIPRMLAPRRRIAVAAGVSAALVAAGVVVAAMYVGTQKPKEKAAAGSTTSMTASPPVMTVPAVPPSAPTNEHASNEVELTLNADGPIESVRAPGTHSVEIDGTRARLVVASWTGTLTVDAMLAGGRAVRANADASGAHALHLDPVPTSRASGRGPAHVERAPAATAPPKEELQESPYGPP
jgi:eukaryotic-like serine/threonine-protein kinase